MLRVGRSGQLLVGLHALTGDSAHLQFAQSPSWTTYSIGPFFDELGMRWHNVEHTAKPPALPVQTGWMRGAAGIGAALLRAPLLLTGSGTGRWLPSWPFAEIDLPSSAA